jgi:phosphoglycerol transferase
MDTYYLQNRIHIEVFVLYANYPPPGEILRLFRLYLQKKIEHVNNVNITLFLCALSLLCFATQLHRVDREFNVIAFVKSYLTSPDEDFFAQNYSVPNENEIVFKNKKDLVVVLSESLESSFFDSKISSAPLQSRLASIKKDSAYFDDMFMPDLSAWTIAAAATWHFGIPLKLPSFLDKNSYYSKRGFLPGAKSIFEILQKNGYKTVLVMGTKSPWSGMEALFQSHGGFTIYDRRYFESKGWSLEENKGFADWGYNDKFILARAKEIYLKLKKDQQPFVLFIETVDTHSPNGYAPKDSVKYGDIRDAIVEADRNLNDFSSFIQNTASDNTAIALIGDHLLMGNPKFLAARDRRRIFNIFWAKDMKFTFNKNKKITTLDIAPTLLELTGATWSSRQFGLGISALSSKPTLVEKYGLQKLNEQLAKKSSYYQKFY